MKAALLVLIAALHSVESDCGLTSANELQITRLVVIDANKAAKKYRVPVHFYYDDRLQLKKSKQIAELYLTYWGELYFLETKKLPSFEVLARIWNGGPTGWKKKATKKYWQKVRAKLPRNANAP